MLIVEKMENSEKYKIVSNFIEVYRRKIIILPLKMKTMNVLSCFLALFFVCFLVYNTSYAVEIILCIYFLILL